MNTRARRPLWWRLFALFAALSLIAAACGDDDGETVDDTTDDTEAEDETPQAAGADGTLQLGYLLPQSGDLAFLGPPMIRAVEMAVEEINEAGGVLGNDVELFGADDGTDPDVASTALDRLIASDRIDAFIGAAASGVSRGIMGKVREAGVVQCSPSNTAADLPNIADRAGGFYFRTAPPDDLQGPALADVIAEDGHETVSIIALNDEYGQGFSEYLRPALEEAGIEVVADVAYDPRGTTFDADVREALEPGPDAVALISFPDTGSSILSTMIEQGAGPGDIPIYTADGMQSGSLYELIDENDPSVVEGIKGTAPSAAPEAGRPGWLEEFQAFAPDTDTIFSAHAYDCAIIIALATVAAGTDEPSAIRDHMIDVTRDGEDCSTFAECVELLEAGEDINYNGASGPLNFTEDGQPGAGSYDVWEFDANGEVVVLRQVEVD